MSERYPVADTLTSKKKETRRVRGRGGEYERFSYLPAPSRPSLPPYFLSPPPFVTTSSIFSTTAKVGKSTSFFVFFQRLIYSTILQPGAKSASRAKRQPLYYESMSFLFFLYTLYPFSFIRTYSRPLDIDVIIIFLLRVNFNTCSYKV